MARYVRLERPVHYGNVGQAFKESKPPDDAYLFPPENTRDVWAHAKTITDRYGFDLHADESGFFVLQGRNNPARMTDLVVGGATDFRSELSWPGTAPTPTLELHPNAYGGTFLEFTGPVTAVDLTVKAARIDLIVPTGTNTGSWQITVLSGITTVGTATINPLQSADVRHFYDYRAYEDGTNATSFTVFSGYYGEYTVRIASTGGSGSTVRRLDALLSWAVDPHKPLLPEYLSTDLNALKAQATSAAADQRNYVIVVGRRQAAVTDSGKARSSTAQNPSNEFVVSSAVDVTSVANPIIDIAGSPQDNPTYIGGIRESIVYDDKVTDQDFAEYLARTFIYRYRMPHAAAQVTHSLLPAVQLGDPVYVDEPTYRSLDESVVRWVNGIRHEMRTGEGGMTAQTELDMGSYPDYPSYNPREDVDIDRFFNGMPVTTLKVSYTTLSNHSVEDLLGTEEVKLQSSTASQVTLSGSGSLGAVAVPGTIYVTPLDTQVQYTVTTERTDVRYIRPGQSFSSLTLGEARGYTPIISVIVYWQVPLIVEGSVQWAPRQATAAKSAQEAQVAVDAGTGSGFWYQFDDVTSRLVVYRLSASPEDEFKQTGIKPINMYAEVKYEKAPAGFSTLRQTNTPYHHLFNVNWSPGNTAVSLVWNQGDNTTPYQPKGTQYLYEFRPLESDYPSALARDNVTRGKSPFYDPYTSELGELVEVSFDALVSGNYRVSIRSADDPSTVVAYLTNPTADPLDEDVHWDYFTAGVGRKLYWDGVDQVGDWNIRQSSLYAEFARGVFPSEERPVVGKGFYVWNNEEGKRSLALISGLQDDGSGTMTGTAYKPVFGHDTFAQWFVYFEVTSERLEEIAEEATQQQRDGTETQQGRTPIRYYSTNSGDGPIHGHPGAIYTHLPAPTRVAVEWKDWQPAQPYDETNTAAIRTETNWITDNVDAVVNNQKPVRLRFTMQPRPGVLWTGKTDDQSVRFLRTVHLRRNLMDQFVEFRGTNVNNKTGSNVEYRRVVSRRASNDDHTWLFADDGFRFGNSFADTQQEGLEWIFQPKHCEKDFRGRGTEQLKFGDYLQLEDLPGWDSTKPLAGQRSRFQIAFINDLFYLSVYTQDRSGRYTWCLDKTFVDKSKIVRNHTRTLEWPDDPYTQHRRFVLCRQWSDELLDGVPYATHLQTLYGSSAVTAALAKHYWHEHNPGAGTIGNSTWASLASGLDPDHYTKWHAQNRNDETFEVPHAWTGDGTSDRQLKDLGNWTWEASPKWAPSVTRDFHGYYCVPPMASGPSDFNKIGTITVAGNAGTDLVVAIDNGYSVVFNKSTWDRSDYHDSPESRPDYAQLTVWQSRIRDNTEAYNAGDGGAKRFHLTTTIEANTKENWITANALDYQRQDDLVHFEQLRGVYTRGPKPEEQPKKQDSVGPYFQNVFSYQETSTNYAKGYEPTKTGHVPTYLASKKGFIPGHHQVIITDFFMMTFRSEYVYESAAMFPTTPNGQLQSGFYNARLAQLPGHGQVNSIKYDGGAWTGWKDEWNYDHGEARQLFFVAKKGQSDNILQLQWVPWCPSSRLPTTRRMLFHLALVNQRRDVPV